MLKKLQVDERSDQHGGEIIGQVLKAHGVEHIFMLGSRTASQSPIYRGAEKNGIRVVQTIHEVTAVAAADASSRVTGLPGVALISSAPGLTNTIAAITAARNSESALVLIGTASSSILREEHLDVTDQMRSLKRLVKWSGKVNRVRDIAYELREALRQALHGTPGPVYIQFTLDCLHPFPVVKRELDRRGSNWYLNYYIQNLFAAGFDVGREIRPWPIEIPFPKKEQVTKIVKAITKAERPLIIMGSQATLPPIDESKIATILQDLAIPCYFEGLAGGILPASHNQHLKHGINEALAGADLVLVLGVPADFRAARVAHKTQLFAVNRNKANLKGNSAAFGDHAVHVHSDVGQFLVEVSEKIGRFAISEEWINNLRSSHATGESTARASAPVASSLDESLPEKTIIVADPSDFARSSIPVLQSKGPWIQIPSTGNISSIAGYLMGAKLARRDHQICALTDITNSAFLLSEAVSCVNHGVAGLVVAGNSSGNASITDPSSGALIANVEAAIEEVGGKGLAVDGTAAGASNLKAGITRAVSLANEGSFVFVNLRLNQ
jgi:acetolactate synthase-like protein